MSQGRGPMEVLEELAAPHTTQTQRNISMSAAHAKLLHALMVVRKKIKLKDKLNIQNNNNKLRTKKQPFHRW